MTVNRDDMDLNILVDELFQVAYTKKMTLRELAVASGLSHVTVKRLCTRATRYPQYRTVQRLAHALGGKISFSKGRIGSRPRRMITWKPKIFAA